MGHIARTWLAIVLWLSVSAAWADAKPRVASVNLCTDQLLLLLADHEQIVSLSYLSADPQYSDWSAQASAYPLNHASAEELVALQPDLVLAGLYNDHYTLNFLESLGISVARVARADSLGGLFKPMLKVGALIGQAERAEAMVADLQARMSQVLLRRQVTDKRLAILGPNAYTQGAGTLTDELIKLAGLRNLASELGKQGNAEYSLEELLVAQPELIAIEDNTINRNSLAQRLLQHPALQRGLSRAQPIDIPSGHWGCPGPSYVDLLAYLVGLTGEAS